MLKQFFPRSSHSKSLRKSRSRRLFVESLEARKVLTTLVVDIMDPGCAAAGPVFCQIQEAIDVADPGDEIEVEDGTYAGIYIPATLPGLSIEAEDDGAIIVGGGFVANVNVFIEADGVTVEGFEIRNGIFGVLVFGPDPAVPVEGVTVEDNNIHDNEIGIALNNAVDTEVEDNELTNNTAGINLIFGSTENEFEDNEINGGEVGITADAGSGDNEFVDNDVQGVLRDGFHIDSDNNTLEGNTSNNNGGDGFQIGGNDNELEDNEANGNGDDGFDVSGENNTFEGNDADGNSFGFYVLGNNNTFEDNEAEDNGGFGFNDLTTGMTGDFGTDNFYAGLGNECDDNDLGDSNVPGLCD